MKKMIAMLLALVMAMSLMACGKQNDSNANDNNDANTGDDQPAAKTTLVVGVSADYAPFEFMYPDENGNMVYGGIDISVAQYVADELGLTLQVENMSFNNLLTKKTRTTSPSPRTKRFCLQNEDSLCHRCGTERQLPLHCNINGYHTIPNSALNYLSESYQKQPAAT